MRFFVTLNFIVIAFSFHVDGKDKIKIACIGASITYGARVENQEQNSYPAQLQKMLGTKYVVHNYGVSSTTLLQKGDKPYHSTKAYTDAIEFNPDVVFIDLGGNDSKLINRIFLNDFEWDYRDLIQSFKKSAAHPRIILLLPFPSFKTDTAGIWDQTITKSIIPHIQQVAFDEGLEVLDMHSLMIDKGALFSDQIHPDATGATIIAQRLYEPLVIKYGSYNIFNVVKPDKISSFYGYACSDFKINGNECKIAQPKFVAEGNPWVWRARFWGHQPQADVALLERGFHIVYCDVVELYGNQESIERWNTFYKLLTNAGLAKKAILEGMSRGGVYMYNWVAVNPKKVAGVYADNPVLDLKSWPGGKGKGPGSKNDWELFKKDYGFTSEAQAMTFKGSPIDHAKLIFKGRYPILHVCADDDEAVPMEENTIPFEKKIKDLGGDITVIHKPGFKHHPHSFPNPKPIVDFILKATGHYISSN